MARKNRENRKVSASFRCSRRPPWPITTLAIMGDGRASTGGLWQGTFARARDSASAGPSGGPPRPPRCVRYRRCAGFCLPFIAHTMGLPHFQFTAFSSFLLEIGILSNIEWNFAKKWVNMSGIEWTWIKLSKNQFIFTQFDPISLNSTHFHLFFRELSLNFTRNSNFE